MLDRGFSETDLRLILEDARALRRSAEVGRWIASARQGRTRWEVVVELDDSLRLLIVVTAYRVD